MSVWVVRAGRKSEIIDPVRQQCVIALGWSPVDDCSQYQTRKDFRDAYQSAYPDDTNRRRVAGNAGQLYRFVREMRVGEVVMTPDSPARQVLIGKVKGEYLYNPEAVKGFPHLRPVDWCRTVSRDEMSPRLRQALSADMTVFTAQGFDEEVQRLLQGRAEPVSEEQEGQEQVDFFEDTQAKADELISDIIAKIDPYDFQDLVAALLRAMGFRTTVSPPGPDGGKDIVAHPDALGFEEPRVKVQVKHTKGPVTAPDVRSFRAVVYPNEKGLFVSTGGFTKEAQSEPQKTGSALTLVDRDKFVDLLTEHYEKLEPEYQAMVPLRKLYIPVTVD